MIFYKTSTLGNDFIVVDKKQLIKGENHCKLALSWCHRRFSIGADGLVLYQKLDNNSYAFEIINSDGSSAELSGNGMAGLAAVLWRRRLVKGQVTLLTRAGRRRVIPAGREAGLYRLQTEIGQADFGHTESFPFLLAGQISHVYQDIEFYPVSIGNPHAVIVLPGWPEKNELPSMAEKLARAPIFPTGVNVEIVHRDAAGDFQVLYRERGAGITMFSGTGSAAVYAVLQKHLKFTGPLSLSFGPEQVLLLKKDETIFIENNTAIVYKGIKCDMRLS